MSLPQNGEGADAVEAAAAVSCSVYVVRHGTTPWNQQGIWQGERDIPLAPEGVTEAEAQAKAFEDRGVRWARCAVTSDLQRASQTAGILAPAIDVTPDPRLRECSLGEFEGLQRDVIRGPKYEHIFSRLMAMSQQERLQAAYFEGLETPQQMSDRALAAVRDLAEKARAADCAGEPLLAVTHSTIMEAVLAVLCGQRYEGIQMRRLAWFRLEVSTSGECQVVEKDGINFVEGHAVK